MEYLDIVREFIMEHIAELIIFLYIGFIIIFIAFIVTKYKNKKLLEKYNLLIRNFNGENLEELILYLQNHVNELNANVNTLKLDTKELSKEVDFSLQNIGFIKYDAFDDMGNEMSYSIAILDKLKNGFVLTSIYGRDHNVSYAKDIENGSSNRRLSAEEIIAVDRALKSQLEEA